MDVVRRWAGLALVILGLLRAALLVGHEPLIGYANQHDMHRTSACIGLFPANESLAPWSATRAAPIDAYRLGARTGGCYFSTEVAIAAAVAVVASATGAANDGIVKLRWIGGAKLALLAVTALLIALALRPHPAAALVHGLVVCLVLGDPVVTLWFNTLYTEFATIWGLYAAIAVACALVVADRHGVALWSLFVVALLALAFSREQFALFGPALVAMSWWWLWRRSRPLTVAAMTVATAACAVSFAVLPRPAEVKQANRADTYLGVVLAASSDPAGALAVLGLPDRCAAVVGANWYLRRGENLEQACPEVFSLSSLAFLKFIGAEPGVLARSAARLLPVLQSVAPAYLGTVEGAPDTGVRGLPRRAFSPLDAIALRIPAGVFVTIALMSFLLVPLAASAAVWLRRSRSGPPPAPLLAMLLGGVACYAFVTTVFGDGFSEASRHYLPGALATGAALIAGVVGVPLLLARWYRAPATRRGEMVAAAVAVALAVGTCVAALNWARSQPLAIGVLDEPAGKQVSDSRLALRGWALDPFGVDRVEVRIGGVVRAAHYGANSPDIAMVFPGYPDAANARFTLDLGGEDLARSGAADPVRLRILVRNRDGVVTEFDGRNLEYRP